MNDFLFSADGHQVYCPLCGNYFDGSSYLEEIFESHPRELWLANMVMHYRHNHIQWWNKMWNHYSGVHYSYKWYNGDYDQLKAKVNNQAKRQILRKAKDFLIENGFTVDDFVALKSTDEKTIELAKKFLPLK